MADFKSRTGSSQGVFRMNGETMAVAHVTASKGYSNNAASGYNSTMKSSYKDPNMKQALTKYHPNAQRNRLPVKFDGEAIAFKRFCQPRNVTSYNFLQGNTPAGYQTYRTTSQNFYDYDTGVVVGDSNQGIVSENSINIHKKQLL